MDFTRFTNFSMPRPSGSVIGPGRRQEAQGGIAEKQLRQENARLKPKKKGFDALKFKLNAH
jgi:hypothetical protein